MSGFWNSFFPEPNITIYLVNDGVSTAFTTGDQIAGCVVLDLKNPLDISQIRISLLGQLTLRLNGQRNSKCQQFLQKTQQIFPQYGQLDSTSPRKLTMGGKQYLFPFSITLPGPSQPYRENLNGSEEMIGSQEKSDIKMPCNATHLLHQLPPSTGDQSSIVQIKYCLEASVKIDGMFKHTITNTHDLNFRPISILQPELQPNIFKEEIGFRAKNTVKSARSTDTYRVAIELSSGKYLALDRRVPVMVRITNTNLTKDDVYLNDYQATLIEEVTTRVGTECQVQRTFHILRTVSNLDVPAELDGKAPGTTATLSDNSWGLHTLPDTICPSFEMYNISHSYKLHIRIGLRGGSKKAITRIMESQFPVQVVSMRLEQYGQLIEKSVP